MKRRTSGKSPLTAVALIIVLAAAVFMMVRVHTNALPPRDDGAATTAAETAEPSEQATDTGLLDAAENKVSDFASELSGAQDGEAVTLDITQEELTALLKKQLDGSPVKSPSVALQGDGVCVIIGTADMQALREQASGGSDPLLPTVLALLPEEVQLTVTLSIEVADGAIATKLLEVQAGGVTLPVGFFQDTLAPAVDTAISDALDANGMSIRQLAITGGLLTLTGQAT